MTKGTLKPDACASCKFFLVQTEENGICRRNPPTVIAQSWMGSPGQVQQGSKLDPKAQTLPVMVYQVNDLGAYFPNMHPQNGWCGAHATRETVN